MRLSVVVVIFTITLFLIDVRPQVLSLTVMGKLVLKLT